jgi:hypothetical protein
VPLAPAEVLARLRERTDPDTPETVARHWQAKPFFARFDGSSFEIRARSGRNANAGPPRLRGEVVATPAGSLVRARFWTHPLVKLILAWWLLAMVASAAGFAYMAVALSDPGSDVRKAMLGFAAVMVLLPGLAWMVIRYFERRARERLRAFLQGALES